MGILDPTKVVRSALQSAASIAGLMVTTEAMVAEEPKEDTLPMLAGVWITEFPPRPERGPQARTTSQSPNFCSIEADGNPVDEKAWIN